MLTRAQPAVRSREIGDSDVDAVVGLLAQGFPARGWDYWQRAVRKLAEHATPAGFPKYGYLLESDGVAVGVILLIFSALPSRTGTTTRCNVSSWYVQPAFRAHAALLISRAIKHKNVTYLNISPAPHTRPIVEAQGFQRYSSGQFVALPAMAMNSDDAVVTEHRPMLGATFDLGDQDLLVAHERHGCRSLWCVADERAFPFVFMPRLIKGVIPCAQLVYCRDVGEFVRFARPLGRYLARSLRAFVIINAEGPIAGLPGRFVAGKSPKYFKGPNRPSFGDLAYTEAVMFGL